MLEALFILYVANYHVNTGNMSMIAALRFSAADLTLSPELEQISDSADTIIYISFLEQKRGTMNEWGAIHVSSKSHFLWVVVHNFGNRKRKTSLRDLARLLRLCQQTEY